MQRHSWLKTVEYISLAGFVLGTFAATIYSQVAYAAVPLTLLLSLNIIDRNRFQQQIRQHTTAEIAQVHQLVESLHNQVRALPAQAIDLAPIHQSLSQLENQTQRLTQQFNARPEIAQIQALKKEIAGLPNPLELKKLQHKIQNLTQKFKTRPEIEQIQQLQEAIAAQPNPLELEELQHQIHRLVQQFNARPEIEQIQELREAIASLPDPLELNELQNKTQSLTQQFNARPEIKQIQELKAAIASHPLELNELQHKTQKLTQQFNTRPEIEQIQELKEVIAALPHPLELEEVKQVIATQVDESVRKFAEQIRAQLALIEPYNYDLVFDRPESRATLMQALKQAQHRLILVCPWIGYGTDFQVIPKLEKLLQRNVCIDIGWGFLDHINSLNNSPGQIRQQLKSYSDFYSNLPQLEALEQKYPQQFKLKLLGTHEKFLVCDSEWVMLGSHNFLTSNASSLERELGLKTNDPRIVAKLIERFESAKDLEKENKKKKIIG